MSSLAERKKELERTASTGVSKPGVAQDDMQRLIAEARSLQNKTIEEQRKRGQLLNSLTVGEQVISSPKPQITGLQRDTQTVAQKMVLDAEERNRSAGAPIRNLLRRELGGIGKFLFGESEETFRGKIKEPPKEENADFIQSTRDQIKSKGIIRSLFFENLLKEKDEKILDGSFILTRQGYNRNEAQQIATSYYNDQDVPINAQLALETKDFQNKAWSLVEALEFFPAYRGFVAASGKTFVRQTLTQSMVAQNAAESRRILSEAFPKLQGTQELEDLSKLSQSFKDDKKAEVFLSEIMQKDTMTPVIADTEVQKALFRTGTPNLRTVAGTADDAFEARKSITSVLRGEREAQRLSNPDVFLSEVRAGSIARNTELSDTVEVFRVGGSGRRAKVGEQVTLSKELAGEGAESFKVPIRDLVRLEDGTFARVPAEQIGRDLTPSINAIRDVVTREKVIAREQAEKTRLQLEKIARENAEKKAKQEAVEREAKERAIKQAEEDRITKAREVVESAKSVSKGTLSKLRGEADRATKAIQSTENKIVKASQKRTALLRASTQKAGLTAGRFVQKFGDYMTVTEKNKVKAGKPLTGAERARIQKRIRDAIDAEINTLKATKDELQTTWRQAGSELTKAKSLLKEAGEAKKVLSEVSETAKKERAIKSETKVKTQAEKAQAVAAKANEEFTSIFKENYSVTREAAEATDIPKDSVGGTVPFTVKPLPGTGEEIANKISQGFLRETDEAYRAFGIEGGLEAVKSGKAKVNSETLEKISFIHKVATNEGQLKSAIIRVMKDPEKAYLDFINSNAMDDSMAALYSALIRSDFILKDATKLNNIVRHFDTFGTRIGQELQAFQMIGRLDYPNLISKMMRKGNEVMKNRGIKLDVEVAKIEKALGDEFDKLVAISKTEALEQLTKITCDV
jgi:hypothetical protein